MRLHSLPTSNTTKSPQIHLNFCSSPSACGGGLQRIIEQEGEGFEEAGYSMSVHWFTFSLSLSLSLFSCAPSRVCTLILGCCPPSLSVTVLQCARDDDNDHVFTIPASSVTPSSLFTSLLYQMASDTSYRHLSFLLFFLYIVSFSVCSSHLCTSPYML